MYHIKREALVGGVKLNEVNCRRLMDQNELIIKMPLCSEYTKKKKAIYSGKNAKIQNKYENKNLF